MVSYDQVLRSLSTKSVHNSKHTKNAKSNVTGDSSSTQFTSTPPSSPHSSKPTQAFAQPSAPPLDTSNRGTDPPQTDECDGQGEQQARVPRPRGRYKKREASKLVGGYSSTDLTAILGGLGDPFGGCQPQVQDGGTQEIGETQAAKKMRQDTGVREEAAEKVGRPKKRKRAQGGNCAVPSKEKAERMAVDRDQDGAMTQEHGSGLYGGAECLKSSLQGEDGQVECGKARGGEGASEDGSKDAWWKGIFVRGSKLQPDDKHSKVYYNKSKNGFLEDEQVELYGRVKDAATQGRVGLGRSKMLKTAGGKWQGKKTKLGSESDSDCEANDPESEQRLVQQSSKLVIIAAKSALRNGTEQAVQGLEQKCEQPETSQPQCQADQVIELEQNMQIEETEVVIKRQQSSQNAPCIQSKHLEERPQEKKQQISKQCKKNSLKRSKQTEGEEGKGQLQQCTQKPQRRRKFAGSTEDAAAGSRVTQVIEDARQKSTKVTKYKTLVRKALKRWMTKKIKVIELAKLVAETGGQLFDKKIHQQILLQQLRRNPSVQVHGKHVIKIE